MEDGDLDIICLRICWSFCCFLVLFPSLFIPGYLMRPPSASLSPLDRFGEMGGLVEHASPCTIVAVYHAPVRYRHLGHHHHPHHPHNPHKHFPHFHSPSYDGDLYGRALEDAEDVGIGYAYGGSSLEAGARRSIPSTHFRHRHSPQGHVHQHTPERTPAKKPSPLKPASDASTTPPSVMGGDDGDLNLAVADADLAVADSDPHRRLTHGNADKCFDRWIFAFAPTTDALDVGEPLGTMRERLLTNAWVEINAVSTANQTPVVLSPPLHRARPCDFNIHCCGTSPLVSRWHASAAFSTEGPHLRIRTASQDYAAPAKPLASLCADPQVGSWIANPLSARIFGNGGRYWEKQGGVEEEWSYELRAPSNWELAHAALGMLYESRQFEGPPPVVANATPCKKSNRGEVTDGCGQRQRPADWTATSCPLRVGGQLTCYHLQNESAGVARMHGCSGEAQAADGLSAAIASLHGTGPPNPYCFSIFPPSWRLSEWVVNHWKPSSNDGIVSADLLLASYVLGGVTLACALAACVQFWTRGMQCEIPHCMPQRAPVTSSSHRHIPPPVEATEEAT